MAESSTQEASHHCVVPDWNLPTRHRGKSLTHLQFQPSLSTTIPPFHFPPRMNIAAEIGALHGLDTNAVHLLPPMPMAPPRWGSCDTLESVVCQATHRDVGLPKQEDDPPGRLRSCTENHRKATRIRGPIPLSQVDMRKRSCTSKPILRKKNACLSSGTCGSGSSTFNMREDDSNTMMTTKLTEDDDASQDESGSKDEEAEARGGTGRTSRYSRQSKTAATTTHNLSVRRRRDRINEKMKALQKMVPNSNNKTDKASMLDEVIVYMKQLQAQVEMMKIMRSSTATTADNNFNVPQMLNAMMTMPPPPTLPPQQQLQMSLLTRMGVGLGLGMLGHDSGTTDNNAFVAPTVPQPHLPHHFLMPQMIPATTFTAGHLNSNVSRPLALMPMHDPYTAFLARKISMDNYYNKLAALHQQQIQHHPIILSDKTQRQ